MLPKERRLVSDYDFRKVRRGGRKVSNTLFDFYYLPTGTPSRFGFVVSTKLDKRAVRRNRAKRILREEVRLLLPRIGSGFDFVFWARKRFLDAKPEQVEAAIKTALRQAGVMRND